MSFQAVGLVGGGLMQTFAVSTAAQSGVAPGTLIAGSDTQGAYFSANQGTNWRISNDGMYPPGHAKLHQVASIMWSGQETGPGGISAIYALTGDAQTGGATVGGGLAVSLDGAQTWTCRSTAVMGAGNHAGTDVVGPPASPLNWPRPAGRLLAEDSTYLYAATYGQGVKRSADHGATWPVTFKMGGTTPAQGAFFCFGMFLAPDGTVWLVTYPTTGSNGGLWKCPGGTSAGQAQSATPNFTAITLPAGIAAGNPGPLTIDVLVLGTVTYLACGSNGLWSNGGGTWGNLSGTGNGGSTGIDTSNGSFWNSLDGYVDAGNNHVIAIGCSNSPSLAVNGIECVAQVTIAGAGTGAVTYKALAIHSTVALDPVPGHGPGGVPGYDPFTTTVGTPLGGNGFVNPCVRYDPSDATHQTLYTSGSNGMYLSANGGTTWQMVNNGFAAFLGHSVACDPNHAGYLWYGDSDWGAWQVSDGIGIGGVTSDSQATIRRMTPGGQAYAFACDPVDSTVYVCYGTGKYGAGTGGVKSKTFSATGWGPSLSPPFTNVPFGACAFRDAAGNKILLVAVGGSGGTAGTIWRYNATAGTWSGSPVVTGFGPAGNAPTLHFPMIYAGNGIVYAADRNGNLFRSTSYGTAGSWANIAGTATFLGDSGTDIAANPKHAGQLWVAVSTGLYKLTGADTGAAIGSGITASAKLTGTHNEVAAPGCIAFDATGNLYCAVEDNGSGSGIVQCAGSATTSPDGLTWADIVGDLSFAQCNGLPENMCIGPDGHIYVSGSNAVAQGFPAGSSPGGTAGRSWALTLNGDGTLTFWWTSDGTLATLHKATSTVPVPLGRTVLRVTASGTAVTFWAAPGGNAGAPGTGAPWTQLGTPVTVTPVALFTSTAVLQAGYSAAFTGDEPAYTGPTGQLFELQLRSATAVVADAGFPTPGALSFTDQQGNAWRLTGTAEISAADYRFHGELSSLPVTWDPAAIDVQMPVQAGGLLRRLSQGSQPPVDSAFKRAVLARTGALTPPAYWPCEDGAGAQQLSAAIGPSPMSFNNPPQLASDSSFACSLPLPQTGTTSWTGPVQPYVPGSGGSAAPPGVPAVVRFLLHVPAAPSPAIADDTVICRVNTGGTVSDLTLRYKTGGQLRFSGYGNGNYLFDTGASNLFSVNGELALVSMELVQGTHGTLNWALNVLAAGTTVPVSVSGTIAAPAAPGNVTVVHCGSTVGLGATAIGHVFVQGSYEPVANFAAALTAYAGETCAQRFARLCGENGIAARVYGPPNLDVAMGAQQPDTLTNLLQLCETTGRGLLYEPRQALALGYRTVRSLGQQAPGAVLDASQGHLDAMAPVDDDQRTVNDVTVSSQAGTSARAVLADGSPLSTGAPPGGTGDYAASYTVNTASDAQLANIAGWNLSIGTVNTERYPAVTADLTNARLASLIPALQALDIGSFLDVLNPPGGFLPPGDIRQLVYGVSPEAFGTNVWQMTFNCVPETPYEVGLFADPVFGLAGTDGSALDAPIGTGDTSFTVDITGPSGIGWAQVPPAAGFGILIGGELMTVTGITAPVLGQQQFTVIRSVNGVVKTHGAGETITLAHPAIIALA